MIDQSSSHRAKVQRNQRWRLILGGTTAAAVAVCFVVAVVAEITASEKPATQKVAQQPSTVSQQIHSLLREHGWQESGAKGTVWTTQLPSSYRLQPGQVPVGLYWAYHNVLSTSVGLDMTPYLGQKIEVHAIPLQEDWTIGPDDGTDAIVITHHQKVIGAWISKSQEDIIVDTCESLNHKEFGDIAGERWGNWITKQHLVNYTNGFYAKMKDWTPKQVLQSYFDAVNSHKYDQAYAMMSTFSQYEVITTNVPPGHLYNTNWYLKGDGLSHWKSVKVLKIQPYKAPPQGQVQSAEAKLYDNLSPAAEQHLTVSFNATFYTQGPLSNGRNFYYSNVVKESANAPWTIGGFGTGP